MANITLQFPRNNYASLQVGDSGWYAILESTAGFQLNDTTEEFVSIGEVVSIDNTTSLNNGTLTTSVTFAMGDDVTPPTSLNFIFFTKNNVVNASSLVGYYGSAKFKNSSTDKAEMFSASAVTSESSK